MRKAFILKLPETNEACNKLNLSLLTQILQVILGPKWLNPLQVEINFNINSLTKRRCNQDLLALTLVSKLRYGTVRSNLRVVLGLRYGN